MTKIITSCFLAFTLKCLLGEEDLETHDSTEITNHIYGMNDSTGPPITVGMELESGTTTRELDETEQRCTLTKHESVCNCTELIQLFPEDYTMINGTTTIYIKGLNRTYNDSFYEIQDGYFLICSSEFEIEQEGSKDIINDTVLFYLSHIGMTVSLLGLFLHLIAFLVVPDMRNLPGFCLACLSGSLLCGYFFFLVGNTEVIESIEIACIACASISHFFILSSLLWMNVKAFTIYKALYHSTSNLRIPSTALVCKNICKLCTYAWGIALIFSVASLISDNVDGVPIMYRPLFARNSCWFNQYTAIWVFFIGPAFVIIGINVVFFGLSVYTIYSNRMKFEDAQQGKTRSYFATYYKLALIMGFLWLSGVFARITNNIVLWYIFSVSNALQGFFIFLAFTCPAVRKYVSQKRKNIQIRITPAVSNTTMATNISMEAISKVSHTNDNTSR